MKRTPIKRNASLQASKPQKAGQIGLRATTIKPSGKRLEQKRILGESSPIRRAAKGMPCLVRIPRVCNGNPETTVLAHYRLGTGGGQKPHDLQGAWACSSCHDAIDGRTRTTYGKTELRLMHAEGVLRTQEALRAMP